VTLSYPPMNTTQIESSAKTLSTRQKRLRNAHLRSKSTSRPPVSTDYLSAALRGSEANKTVSSDPPAACPSCRRTRASTADARLVITTAPARDRHAATTPIDIVKAGVSDDESTKSASVSVERKMQIADNSTSEKYVHVDAYHFCPQRQDRQINTVNVQTLLPHINSANKCRVIDNTSTEKITTEGTTAYTKTCGNQVHKHWFRRKKRQKAEGTAKENRRL